MGDPPTDRQIARGADGPRPPAGWDLRLLPGAAAAWAAAWVALGLRPAWAVALALPGGLAAGAILVRQRRSPRPAAAVLAGALACAAGAGVAAAGRVAGLESGPLPALAREEAAATLSLTVTADPRVVLARGGAGPPRELVLVPARAEQVVARGRTTSVRSPVVVFAADRTWLGLIPGQRARAAGRLGMPRPGDVTAAVLRATGPPADVRAAGAVQRAADRVRRDLRESVGGLPPDPRGLVPGLVLGDTSGVSEDLAADFRTAGLTHVVAVSGANLAIVLGAVLALAWCAGVGLRMLPVAGVLAMAGFLVLARPEPSLLRATVMGTVAVVGLASGRGGRGAPALCAAVVVLVLLDPWLARAPGFALSVLATAGLLALAPAWRDRLARHMPRPVATALAVPAAAQAACGPVVVLLSGGVSLVAVPANLAAAPAVAPAMLAGFLAALTGPVCPPLGRLFGELAGLPARWIVLVARTAADVPGASLPWPDGVPGALLLAALTAAGGWWWRCRSAARDRPPPAGARRRRLVPVAASAVAAVLVLRPALPQPPLPGPLRALAWPPADWRVAVCDVGQGDAVALAAGPRAAVVVDAGPEPRAVDRCLDLLGVRRVPYLLLTHFHADHVEGVPGVLAGRDVAEIGVSPLADPPAEAERVARWAAAAGVRVTTPAVGETRTAGALRWRVLWPRRVIAEGSAANNASVVLLAQTAGVRILLTGDIEPSAQAALLRAEPGLRADVLKVPHHGSRHQYPDLLAELGARVALTSVGSTNDYGHPSPATLDILRAAGVRSARTDIDGDVVVAGTAGALRLVGRRGAGQAPGPAG